MKILDESKFNYLGFATLDNIGRVFEFDGNIYRGIYPGKQLHVKRVFETGLLGELVKQDLFVETHFTEYTSVSFPLILEHKKLTATFPTDWSFSMLKDAAKTILRVNELCNLYGYELSDAHPYNIGFDMSVAKWLDFGSIRKQEGKPWKAMPEFINATLAPLAFIANNELMQAYSLLQAGRTFKLFSKPFRETIIYKNFLKLMSRYSKDFREEEVTANWIDEYSASISKIDSFWGDYQKEEASIVNDMKNHPENKFNRFFKLAPLVKKYATNAKTSLDLAGNIGLASFILSQELDLQRVINVDYDSLAIDKSYNFLKKNPGIKVESYVQNFMLPMQSEKIINYKSDLVFALAITHHLLLSQGFKINGVFENIKKYSKGYVFIEFMPLGLWGGDINLKPKLPKWYTQDWFKSHFEKHFKLLEVVTLESHKINQIDEPHRVLFIGKL